MQNFDPEIQLNQSLSDESYYHQIFQKVSFYSPEIYKIFNIARLLNSSESDLGKSLESILQSDFEREEELQKNEDEVERSKATSASDDYFIDNLKTIREFPYILKKQFLLPDEIFDQKLMYHDLLIKKQEQREKRLSWAEFIKDKSELSREKQLRRQRTYVLLDISASMEKHDRILLAKAIIISFLENNQKEFGELFFRSFNHELSDLERTYEHSDYKRIINQILPIMPEGQTNTEKALLTAMDDIREQSIDEQAEILLLTDGLCQIDVEQIFDRELDVKINIVLIGKDSIHISDAEMKEFFKEKHQREVQRIESQFSSEKAKAYQQKYERFHKLDREKVEKELQSQYLKQLNELAIRSSGVLIEIEDLDQKLLSDSDLIHHIRRELDFLKTELERENLSPLERDQLLKQYFSLQNYLNSLLKENPAFGNLKNEMMDFLNEHKLMMEYIKNSSMHIEMSLSDLKSLNQISFYELFKIIFHKVKVVFFRAD